MNENILKNFNLNISYKRIKNNITDIIYQSSFYKISKKQFYLDIHNIAKYFVKSSDEIYIDSYKNSLKEDRELFLYDSILPVYFMQNNYICLNGTAISKNNKITLIIGYGCGKSSIAQKLIQKHNYNLICDNYIVIKDKTILNSSNILHLWEDVALNLNYNLKELKPLRKNISKYEIVNNEYNFSGNENISKIYILEPKLEMGLYINEIQSLYKATEVLKCIRGINFYEQLSLAKRDFPIIINLVNNCQVKVISMIKKFDNIKNINCIYKIIEQDL